MTADWRTLGWWDLPGPDRFLNLVATRLAGAPQGVVGLANPEPAPFELMPALRARLRESMGAEPIDVDVGGGGVQRSPAHALAAAAGAAPAGIRTVAEFVDAPELGNAVFVVRGLRPQSWVSWGMFLRALRAERERRARLTAPVVLVVVPPGLQRQEVEAALGEPPVRWRGRIGRVDVRLFVERHLGWPGESMAERVAVATAVELGGWDAELVRSLVALGPEALLDPLRHLEPYAEPLRGIHPTWENGLVDLWEGEPYPHTLALLAAGDTRTLRRRLWRARSEATLPILGEIRHAFALRYHDRLAAVCPFEKRFHDRVTYITEPFAFEFWDLNAILRGAIPEEEEWLLRQCHRLRMAAAHFDAGDAQTIADVSHAWSEMAHDFADACRGWDWPRCGQTMTLMVGPSGAGKSRWARRNHDAVEVVSSDEIHAELYGDVAVDGDKAPVFADLRRRAIELLASGRSVCIDATNLRRADRLANVRLAPPDMQVRYVVVDRPMAEKEATAGWRAEKPGLLLRHEALFAQELPAILARDELPNVTLVDLIEHEPSREAAA